MTELARDLFGELVPANRAQRGRPPHVRTVENARKIQIALALGLDEQECAEMLGVSMPTLRKHYFHELAGRARARLNLRMKVMAELVEESGKGNVAAGKALLAEIRLAEMPGGVNAQRGKGAKPPKPGKKEQALAAARDVGSTGDSRWSFLNDRPN